MHSDLIGCLFISMSGDSSRTNQTVQNEAVFKLVGIVQLLQFTGLEWRKKAGQEVDRKRCALGLNVSSKSHRYSANSATAAIRCDWFFFLKKHVFYLTSHPSQPCCGWRSSTQALVHASILLEKALKRLLCFPLWCALFHLKAPTPRLRWDQIRTHTEFKFVQF